MSTFAIYETPFEICPWNTFDHFNWVWIFVVEFNCENSSYILHTRHLPAYEKKFSPICVLLINFPETICWCMKGSQLFISTSMACGLIFVISTEP
jgi:hypothetical protein